MLKRVKNSRGDTIVEVLLALAILSLAFAISYATANRALIDSQNSQEHTLALEYLDGQIEALRYVLGQPGITIPAPPTSFYLTPDLAGQTVKVNSGTGIEQGSGFKYKYSIVCAKDSSGKCTNTYHADISWPGLGNLGPQSEELSYRDY